MTTYTVSRVLTYSVTIEADSEENAIAKAKKFGLLNYQTPKDSGPFVVKKSELN